ncbi:MAG: CocE/NonD family hydrolase, partial [Alphaproteobacteria bacterium]|nr:CocE/NonD family hydrolase [Alphaproteobacteria bacterium]
MSTHAPSIWSLPGLVVHHDTPVRMRDGVTLATDIYMPDRGGPFPALLLRTPYDKGDATETTYAHAAWYAQHGFAALSQDVRGRWQSGGDFVPFASEAADGHDTIAWIAAQPWCSGKVATYGFSYPGATQMLAAPGAPPALAAMAPAMTGSSYCEGWTFRAGTFELAFILGWVAALARDQAIRAGDLDAAEELTGLVATPSLLHEIVPLRAGMPAVLSRYAPYLHDWMAHPEYDSYWKRFSPIEGYSEMRAPGLHIAGWYDSFLTGTLENFEALSKIGGARQRLIVGPWYHMPWSQHVKEADFGSEARNIVDDLQLKFFSRVLLEGKPDDESPTVQLFVMGEDRWITAESWPPPPRETRTLFLASDGRANSLSGAGRLTPDPPAADARMDALPCNPLFPVASVGGRSCCFADAAPMGPADQRCQEIRTDVLVYTSEPLDQDLHVIGYPQVMLHLATDTPSADVIVRLTDVHPDGRSLPVSDGVYRLRAGEADGGKVARTEIR